MKPMAPKPAVASSTSQVYRLSRSIHSRAETSSEPRISIPPMVGVPDLDWWLWGPSARMDSPSFQSLSLRISQGPHSRDSASAVRAA